MAQRTVALCDGKYIGIETIYTVIDGKQINIREKLDDLRSKSQNNKLFCPCGCGTNLILVAGDKNLREQHFREKKGTGKYECSMPIEGKVSIDSKIVLKCWLDDKLKTDDIESRVPIASIEETTRRPEFTFLSKQSNLAIRYWKKRQNIVEDKLDVLTDNLSGIKVVYIVDCSNCGTNNQYPEALMKIQDKQHYCLMLSVVESEYEKAEMKAVFYEMDIDGFWKEIVFAEGKLNEFEFDNYNIVFNGKLLKTLLNEAREIFKNSQAFEEQRRLRDAENSKKIREENERRWKEEQRKREEAENERLRRQAEEEQNKQLQAQKAEEEFLKTIEEMILQQDVIVRDPDGNRWAKCEFCGRIKKENEFSDIGGAGRVNRGICTDCCRNNPAVKERTDKQLAANKKKYDPTVCPECKGKLIERKGRFGSFIGCSNFPNCEYTRPIIKRRN